MTQFKRLACSLLVFASVGLIGYTVFAQTGAGSRHRDTAEDGKKIAAQLDRNKLTLAKAVEAAEDHTKIDKVSALERVVAAVTVHPSLHW